MSPHPRADRGAVFASERIPDNLLRDPLDYMAADHFRIAALRAYLEGPAQSPMVAGHRQGLARVGRFLSGDFAAHRADETEDLYPRLRDRCPPEDEVAAVLDAVVRGHETDELLATGLAEALAALVQAPAPALHERMAKMAAALAESLHHHLPLETETILPLARRRLEDSDLDAIGRRMATRRGIDYADSYSVVPEVKS